MSQLQEPLPSCRQVVDLITDYLEGRMSAVDRERFERHLVLCDGCVVYLEQMRTAIAASRAAPDADVIPADQRGELVAAFRDLFRPA